MFLLQILQLHVRITTMALGSEIPERGTMELSIFFRVKQSQY